MIISATPSPSRLPATDRVLPRLSPEFAEAIPREVMESRVGKGTVASELERSIRVRFEGDGPVSQRSVVPETKAAVELLKSPSAESFTKAMRAIASVADAHEGAENLQTIALYPDEHASKAGSVLDIMDSMQRGGEDPQVIVTPPQDILDTIKQHMPGATDAEIMDFARRGFARAFTLDVAADTMDGFRNTLARNLDGHVAISPASSRELLATLGLYQPTPDDSVMLNAETVGNAALDSQLRESWRTTVHEVHHSVSPMTGSANYNNETSRVLEEAIPSILERMQGSKIARKAGADIKGTAERLGTTGSSGSTDAAEGANVVGWKPWNRQHLPSPTAAEGEMVERRYVNGPQLIRDVIKLTGVDRRTREGIARTEHLLQSRPANEVPEVLAQALAESHGLDAAGTQQAADLIRKASVGDATLADIKQLISG